MLSANNRMSWSSSGDTSYYDAREHLTEDELASAAAADAVVGSNNPGFQLDGEADWNSQQDPQAAHARATAYYDNAAYFPRHTSQNGTSAVTVEMNGNGTKDEKNEGGGGDGGGTLKAFRKKRKQQQQQAKKPKKRLPYHLTQETNVDSTTTADEASAGRNDENTTDDDFGFKYRPAIPPPRPLQTSPSKQATLTLQDALDMKAQKQQQPAPPVVNVNSGILLETNIDSELDDNSSIPSSYYPDVMIKQPHLLLQQHQQNGLTVPNPAAGPTAGPRVAAAFHFNTAVREEDEKLTTSSGTEIGGGGEPDRWSETSATAVGVNDEVPRMATWSPRSPNSPSSTVIEAPAAVPPPQPQPVPQQPQQLQGSLQKRPILLSSGSSAYHKSPAMLPSSMASSVYSQAPMTQSRTLPKQQQPLPKQPMPPRMLARLDTDFEVSSDEVNFTETTPGDMAILEYSRALEEAERMRNAAAGNYVFAQPPGSQFTNSVPEYINYMGRDTATLGSVGLRAKSMNTLNSSRNSLRSSGGGGRVLLTPGRARRASLRRSRLGLTMPDEADSVPAPVVYSVPVQQVSVAVSAAALSSGNSRTNFLTLGGPDDFDAGPEVQHHGPLRSATVGKKKPTGPVVWCEERCCPNTPRKKLVRWLLIAGIVACAALLAVAVAVIVVTTRPKDTTSTAATGGTGA